jgi:hypothetical protein
MRRPIGVLVCIVVAAALVGAALGATHRTANCGGLCLYVFNGQGEPSFSGTFKERPNAPATKPWLRLSNTANWKLTLGQQFTGSHSTAELHLGTPSRPGRLLAALCKPCGFRSHGRFQLSDETLATIFAGTPYLGGGLPVNAYLALHTPMKTVRLQLRDG